MIGQATHKRKVTIDVYAMQEHAIAQWTKAEIYAVTKSNLTKRNLFLHCIICDS